MVNIFFALLFFLKNTLAQLHFLGEFWNNVKEITDQSIICHLKNGCLWILIDCHNRFGILHSRQVLNGTGYSNLRAYTVIHIP